MVYPAFLHKPVVIVVFTFAQVLQIIVAQSLQLDHILIDVRPKTTAH